MRIMRRFLEPLRINRMYPETGLGRQVCSTACRVQLGAHYVAYVPDGRRVEVDLRDLAGSLKYEWMDPRSGQFTGALAVEGSAVRAFSSPFAEAVLYIHP